MDGRTDTFDLDGLSDPGANGVRQEVLRGRADPCLTCAFSPQELHCVSSLLWTQGSESWDKKGTMVSYSTLLSILKLLGSRGKKSKGRGAAS